MDIFNVQVLGHEGNCSTQSPLPRVAVEHVKCDWSELDVKSTADFKDIIQGEKKV